MYQKRFKNIIALYRAIFTYILWRFLVKEIWNFQRSIFFKIVSNRTLQKVQIFLWPTFSVNFRKLFKMTKYLALSGYIALGRNDINDNNCNSATAATKKKAAKITKKQHQQPNIDCHLLRFRIIADARHFSVLQNDQTCCVPPPSPRGYEWPSGQGYSDRSRRLATHRH